MTTTTLNVASADAYQRTIQDYARQGYQILRDEGHRVTLSRKKPFNWIVAIICLFIPIIGWIALAMMIMAANRGSDVVEIVLNHQA